MIATAHLLALLAAPAGVTDVHHGVKVVDAHRWLEDGNAPAVDAWTRTRHAEARTMLAALPLRSAIATELKAIYTADRESWGGLQVRGGQTFLSHRPPGAQQPILKVFPGDRTLLDPLAEDPTGKTHIDWFRPSPDGSLVAVSLSKAGTESGDVHILLTATGMAMAGEVVPRVNGGTAGGDLVWTADGKGFHYTRYPRAGERPAADMAFHQQLWRHTLGESKDTYVLGKDLPRTAQIRLDSGPGDRLLATVQHGDGGIFELHANFGDGRFKPIAGTADGIVQGTWAPDGTLFLISRKGAPKGQVTRHGGGVVVAEGGDTVLSNFYAPPTMVATADRLYVSYQLGGPSTVRSFDHAGKPQPKLAIPDVSSVSSLQADGDGVILHIGSFTDAGGWYRLSPDGQLKATKFMDRTGVRFDDVEVIRELATSKDGTRVPVNILRVKGPRTGDSACIVTGYGGYGLSLAPRFRDSIRVLLDRGVCYAVANLRGGGEFGATWHSQGHLTAKQNVFDDFAAVVEHLSAKRFASAKRIGIIGGSNGGLLMGATLTQRPELPAVVVSFVGIYDMLRVELSPNGAFNIPEFGTVKDKAQFMALHAYSPYHNVATRGATAAKNYPPLLLLTGANDPRVDPMQSRKFLARLHVAGAKDRAWLRVSFDSGHGGGAKLDERIAQRADAYAFLLHHLGCD